MKTSFLRGQDVGLVVMRQSRIYLGDGRPYCKYYSACLSHQSSFKHHLSC